MFLHRLLMTRLDGQSLPRRCDHGRGGGGYGSAVDQTNITHELQRFHEAGLGGVQITSIYGVKTRRRATFPILRQGGWR